MLVRATKTVRRWRSESVVLRNATGGGAAPAVLRLKLALVDDPLGLAERALDAPAREHAHAGRDADEALDQMCKGGPRGIPVRRSRRGGALHQHGELVEHARTRDLELVVRRERGL